MAFMKKQQLQSMTVRGAQAGVRMTPAMPTFSRRASVLVRAEGEGPKPTEDQPGPSGMEAEQQVRPPCKCRACRSRGQTVPFPLSCLLLPVVTRIMLARHSRVFPLHCLRGPQ